MCWATIRVCRRVPLRARAVTGRVRVAEKVPTRPQPAELAVRTPDSGLHGHLLRIPAPARIPGIQTRRNTPRNHRRRKMTAPPPREAAVPERSRTHRHPSPAGWNFPGRATLHQPQHSTAADGYAEDPRRPGTGPTGERRSQTPSAAGARPAVPEPKIFLTGQPSNGCRPGARTLRSRMRGRSLSTQPVPWDQRQESPLRLLGIGDGDRQPAERRGPAQFHTQHRCAGPYQREVLPFP